MSDFAPVVCGIGRDSPLSLKSRRESFDTAFGMSPESEHRLWAAYFTQDADYAWVGRRHAWWKIALATATALSAAATAAIYWL